ncbi:MAG TPA: hypothetical protein VGH65_00235, partial [Verrucomicrobiaceae bacterium]
MVSSFQKEFRIGDWVEVRQLPEILATLDDKASFAGLPFMPEMAKYCGRKFQVVKSAHKTCDPTGCTDLRRMADAVHLETRCDGSGHDGCEARCLIYWKAAWLKPAGEPTPDTPSAKDSDLKTLERAARISDGNGVIRYRCQVT